MIIGLSGSAAISKGSHTMTSAVIDTGNDLLVRVQNIGDKLSALNYTRDVGQQIQEATNGAQDILDQGKSVEKEVDDGNKYR
jgi:hypothetical protein